jgi:TPR repeat protein
MWIPLGLALLAASPSVFGACELHDPLGSAGGKAVALSERESDQDTKEAINRLGIQYARGRGVPKDYKLAFRMFRQLALDGYTPGMVNLGTLYEMGPIGLRNHRRAYAWIRAALALGVPEQDYDATLFKLGVIAGRLGAAKVSGAERLAMSIIENVMSHAESPAEQYADIPNIPLTRDTWPGTCSLPLLPTRARYHCVTPASLPQYCAAQRLSWVF